MTAPYLFDCMALVWALQHELPDKWVRSWDEVAGRRRQLLLFEPLISEVYYQLSRRINSMNAKSSIIGLKSNPGVIIHPLDDNDAILAGQFKNTFHGLSLVDCYNLALAQRHKAKIFSTDIQLREAAKSKGVMIDYIPFKASI